MNRFQLFATKAIVSVVTIVFFASLPRLAPAQTRDTYDAVRERMVERYIVSEGISNKRVIASMKAVPRHEFVPGNLRKQAYFDGALPIGHKQTISPPYIVAYMTEILDPQPEDKVLEIGTGSGYQAAVLSGLVRNVYSIEIVAPLGKMAAARLEKLGYSNVETKVGDGYQGWAEHAPFDKIIVTCSPESIPAPLIAQLKEGGRMIIPLGERYQQVFHLLEKKDGKLVEKQLIPTLFVPMTGASEDQRKVLPNPAAPKVINGGFEKDENEDGRTDNWHYQRQTEMSNDGSPEGKHFLRFTNNGAGQLSQALQGMAIDGRRVRSLTVSLLVRHVETRPGSRKFEQPALMVIFYDSRRGDAGGGGAGPFLGTRDWHRVRQEIPVPNDVREAIVRIGLNGGTGTLDIDDVSIEAHSR